MEKLEESWKKAAVESSHLSCYCNIPCVGKLRKNRVRTDEDSQRFDNYQLDFFLATTTKDSLLVCFLSFQFTPDSLLYNDFSALAPRPPRQADKRVLQEEGASQRKESLAWSCPSSAATDLSLASQQMTQGLPLRGFDA